MKNRYDPDYVRQLFDQMSGSYERMNYITSFGFSIRWRKQFLSKLGKSNQKLEVIDLLSGLGENWRMLKKQFPESNFHALDFSEKMVENSIPQKERIFKGHLELTCQNVLNSQLQPNHFDVVSCAFGLKTFNNKQLELFAKEVKRILKPGGQFSLIEISVPSNRVLRYSFKFYLKRIVPVLGKVFLGNPDDYRMLWIYTEQFTNCKNIIDIFEAQGLNTNYEQYFFGCATGISGTKQ